MAIGTSTNANSTPLGTSNAVTFASNGTASVVWYDGTNVKVSYASSPYTSWTSLTASAASGIIAASRLDTSDTVNLALYVSAGIDYQPFTLSSTTYSAGSLTQIASGAGGANGLTGCIIEKDPQNRYWVVTSNRGGSSVLAYDTTTPATAGWTLSNTTSWSSGTQNEFPAAGIVGNYLLFIYPSAASTFQYKRLDVSVASLGSWSSATAFTPGGSSVTSDKYFSFRGNSTVGVQANDSGSGIWARVYTPGTDTFATAVQLSSGANDARPTVIAGSDGNFYVFWQSFVASNNFAIVYKKYTVASNTWDSSPTTAVSSGANNFGIAGGSNNGVLGIVYQTGTASPYNINFFSMSVSSATTANKSTGLRLRMSASRNLSAGVRLRMSAQGRKSTGLRLRMFPQSTRSTGLRVRMAALRSLSAGVRLRMTAQSTRSMGLRTRLSAQRKLSAALRLVMVATSRRSTGLRVRMGPLARLSMGIRLNMVALNPNAYTILIGNKVVMVLATTLSVEQTIGKRAQASFVVYSPDTSTHYQQYQAVTIYDQFGALAFTGYIMSPRESKPGFQTSLLTQIQCADQHYLADKRIVAKSYAGQTRATIVRDLLNTILSQEGVTVGAIVDEDANVSTLYPRSTLYPSATLFPQGSAAGLVNATFTYATVAQALDALTKDANQSGIPYFWMIDKFKRLFWVPYTYRLNPNIVDGTTIDQESPTYLTRANPLYGNKQYVVGGTNQTAVQTEVQPGDGSTRSWTVGFQIAKVPKVSTNIASAGYVQQSVGIKGIDTGKAFYWNQGESTITQDSSQTVLAATDLIQIVYIGQYPITTSASSDAQISAQASLDFSSGINESVVSDSSLTTAADGLAKATGLISRNAVNGMLFEYTTQDNTYVPGEMRTYTYDPHGLNNTQMLIESATASDQRDGVNIWYAIKAVMGPYDQTWQDFFAAIVATQQQQQAINAGVQAIISTTQMFSASLTLSISGTATIGTASTLYGSNALSSLLSTASQMSATIGGTETGVFTHISGGGHFGEITSRGLSVTAVSAIPTTPTGNGWVYKPGATTTPGGNWSAIDTMSFADWQSGNTVTIRFFKLSGGVYTSIGTITVAVTGRAKTTYRYASTLLSSVSWAANDLLVVDRWLFDSSGTGGDNPTIYLSNNGAAGVTNDAQIITPGF